MGPMTVVSDFGLAAVFAAVAYFGALGILLVFVERIEPRVFLSISASLAGVAVGLVALGEAALSAVVSAGLGAFATDQAIELLGAA